MFSIWYEKEYGHKNRYDEKVEEENKVYWTSGQDFFTITNDGSFMNPFHAYTFVVEGDCVFGWTEELKNKVIKPAENVY